jgi:hypothetical protein
MNCATYRTASRKAYNIVDLFHSVMKIHTKWDNIHTCFRTFFLCQLTLPYSRNFPSSEMIRLDNLVVPASLA